MASRYSSLTVKVLYGLIAIAVIGYLLWPYGSLARLYLALKNSDTETVEEMVAWPMVEEGFNMDINRFIRSQSARQLSFDNGRMAIALEFDNTSLGRDLAAKLARPETLILLFHRPDILECMGRSLTLGEAQAVTNRCNPEGRSSLASTAAKENGGVSGPSLARISEKTTYAFFTGLFSFRLNVRHEGVPMEIHLRRAGIGWKVTRILASFTQEMRHER